MKLTITTTPHAYSMVITQELTEQFDGVETKLMQWIYKTRDAGVRDALIKLGWTPPEEHKQEVEE